MRRTVRTLVLAGAGLAGLTAWTVTRADTPPKAEPAPASARPEPKPISDVTKKGLAFLVAQQLPNGGWAQGEESTNMRGGGEPSAVANVGDTCIAALALIRAGNTPQNGQYSTNVAKAVAFVCSRVEKSSADDLSVTDVHGTRLQSKLGTHIDTFLASLLLAEIKGKMGNGDTDKQVVACLDKVVGKISKNQKSDGGWANAGWAPVLAQSIAAKGLNRAAQNGVAVRGEVLARVEKNARDNYQSTTFAGSVGGAGLGGFKMEGAANVPLYAGAANAAAGQDAVNTRLRKEQDLKKTADDVKAPTAEREKARDELKRVVKDNEQSVQAQQNATRAIISQLGDKQFVAGFGSNGGEEFLSYMQISETLLAKGGKEWQDFDKSMTENLGRIQNPDGSWSGHHCITGRTFCTSAAVLVLLADRAPVPACKVPEKVSEAKK
jgi:hypothetical protein